MTHMATRSQLQGKISRDTLKAGEGVIRQIGEGHP